MASTTTTTESESPSEPLFAIEIGVPDLRVGDLIASRVDERSGRVIGKTVKVETIRYSDRRLYAFVNKRFRYDMGGLVHRVA